MGTTGNVELRMTFSRTLKAAVVAGEVALLPMAGAASTVVTDGDSVDVTSDDFFKGVVTTGSGGAGTFSVEFTSLFPTRAQARATICCLLLGEFTNLTISWIDSQGTGAGTVLATKTVTQATELTTLFDGFALEQYLTFAWDDSAADTGFDFTVQANVPLPAGGVLILTGLGALGLAGRRRKPA